MRKSRHLSKNSNWRTPDNIVNKARKVMESIDLDPASDEDANKIVKAGRILTEEDDGLLCSWGIGKPVNVFLNPPGGKVGNKSLPALFIQRLFEEIKLGKVKQAIVILFSIEQLSVAQNYVDFRGSNATVCVPKRRINFVPPSGVEESGNTHASAILYLPGRVNYWRAFKFEFSSLGQCWEMWD